MEPRERAFRINMSRVPCGRSGFCLVMRGLPYLLLGEEGNTGFPRRSKGKKGSVVTANTAEAASICGERSASEGGCYKGRGDQSKGWPLQREGNNKCKPNSKGNDSGRGKPKHNVLCPYTRMRVS